jgi:hypothetical protein
VDVLEPVNVDRLVKLLSISVERDETDLWRVERFEPDKVETKPTLAFIYIKRLLFWETKTLLIIFNSSPTTVENDETD